MNQSLEMPTFGDDAVASASELLGQAVRTERWNEEASKDVIRHYAWGIGDDNPLWCDEEYAARTRWRGIIAPPTFLYSVFDAVVAPGLPDIQWIYAGADWTFERPVRRNEEVLVEATLADVKQVGGDVVSRMILQTGDVRYRTRDGETLAQVRSHTFRIPRARAEGGLRYERREEHRYTAEELERIEHAVLNEERRGAEPRYWEDVEQNDVLPATVRGPLNRLDMTCYYAGAVGTSGYKSTRLRWLYGWRARNAPELLPNNFDKSYYGAAISPSIGHQDGGVATSEIGMPGPYDNGPQRIGFVAGCITNWMGDDGELRRYGMRLHKPVIFGDTTYCKGRVAGKRRDGGRALVDIEMRAENQLGEVTASGTATVQLPTRD